VAETGSDCAALAETAVFLGYFKGPGLAGVAIVESTRELPGKAERETRFYITSLSLPAERVGPMIRDHWAVESAPQAHTRRRFAMN